MTVDNQLDFSEKEINESVLLWIEATLHNVPEHFKYFRDNKNSEIAVFLPRYLRVRAANALLQVAQTTPFTEETLREPIVINGWKIVDGYENLMVICALRYAAMDPMYTVRIPIPNPSGTLKTTMTFSDSDGVPKHSMVDFAPMTPWLKNFVIQEIKPGGGITHFYEPTAPGSDVWKKYAINKDNEIEFEKQVKIDRELLLKGRWVEIDTEQEKT